jgi:hypothetical protein
MTAFRLFIAGFALTLSGAALGQSGERGSIPPGQSRDGAAPSDGAIKGGTILPGETGGMPDKRCEELSGTLREECLKQEREAASGETRRPGERPSALPRERDPRRP